MTKAVLEPALAEEMTGHLGYEKHDPPRRESGKQPTTAPPARRCTPDTGAVDLAGSPDRNRTFEPQTLGKRQTRLEGFNKRIIALHTRGMTTGDIRARAAKHETRQHTLGGMNGAGKPAQPCR